MSVHNLPAKGSSLSHMSLDEGTPPAYHTLYPAGAPAYVPAGPPFGAPATTEVQVPHFYVTSAVPPAAPQPSLSSRLMACPRAFLATEKGQMTTALQNLYMSAAVVGHRLSTPTFKRMMAITALAIGALVLISAFSIAGGAFFTAGFSAFLMISPAAVCGFWVTPMAVTALAKASIANVVLAATIFSFGAGTLLAPCMRQTAVKICAVLVPVVLGTGAVLTSALCATSAYIMYTLLPEYGSLFLEGNSSVLHISGGGYYAISALALMALGLPLLAASIGLACGMASTSSRATSSTLYPDLGENLRVPLNSPI